MTTPRYDVLGVQVHATTYALAADAIVQAAQAQRAFAGTALAVHGVMTGVTDAEHRARLNTLDLVTPDGQPVRWALNWLHHTALRDRVYGPFLMREVCHRAESNGLKVFFYGSDSATLNALRQSLGIQFPALRIAGSQPSRFRRATEEEWNEDVALLKSSGAEVIFCGLGCPRQEVWVYEMREYINAPLIAVGAAFPFLAGRLAMAPAWMQRSGLEWLFRWSREPGRLWRRYFIYNPWFVWRLFSQKLRGPQKVTVVPTPRKLRYS